MNKDIPFFTKLIKGTKGICSWEFLPSGELVGTNCQSDKLSEIFFKQNLTENALKYHKPVIYSNINGLSWISCSMFESDRLTRIYVLGPVCFDENYDAEHKNDAADFLGMDEDLISAIKSLPILAMEQFFQYAIMLHFTLYDESIKISDLHHYYASKEIKKDYNSYSQGSVSNLEYDLLKTIENGDLNHIKAHDKLVALSASSLGKLANFPLRQAKNQVIIFTGLACLSAIKGGLSAELAYRISDAYIQSVEQSESLGELAEISHSMEDDYVKRVYKIKSAKGISKPIHRCLDYIELHFREKITATDLASVACYSKDYFEKKFINEVKVSPTDYLNNYRIEKAKEMLASTDKDIGTIAQLCGFNSQSYFGLQFKKKTGTTPAEYREHNYL